MVPITDFSPEDRDRIFKEEMASRRRALVRSKAPVALAAAAVIVAAASVAFALQKLSGANDHKITGTFTLLKIVEERSGGSCSGEGGYSDIDEGQQVVVKDAEGRTLAKGNLGAGRLVGFPEATSGNDEDTDSDPDRSAADDLDFSYCQFKFTVEDVPEADFYAVSVGRRGELTYSYAEMKKRDWKVSFSLGS